MNYFIIIRNNNHKIIVDNFHPRWREAVKNLEDIVPIMEKYADKVSEWSGIRLDIDFSEKGLEHLKSPKGGSLDLVFSGDKYRYVSNKLNSAEEGAINAVINKYIIG